MQVFINIRESLKKTKLPNFSLGMLYKELSANKHIFLTIENVNIINKDSQ